MRASLILLLACVACSAATASIPPSPAPVFVQSAEPKPDVAVEVHAPLDGRYIPQQLGPEQPTLAVVVRNDGPAPLDVSDFRVHLRASREGTPLACGERVGARLGGNREPSTLEPGETHTFERPLDCALPLVGAYAIEVGVSFGHAAWSTPRDIRAFTFTVTPSTDSEPRRVDSVPGLWAAFGANTFPGGVRGAYGRIAIGLVNGGTKPITLPPLTVALRVLKVGTELSCEGEPVALHPPAVLEPGGVHHEPVEVSCMGLGTKGEYVVVVNLRGPGDDETELGRLHVDVVIDPGARTLAPRVARTHAVKAA